MPFILLGWEKEETIMPYQRRKNKIYVYKGNRWILKQTCGSTLKAQRAMRFLKVLEGKEWKVLTYCS